MKHYLLQHGNYGEGPVNPYLISESKKVLIDKVKRDVSEKFIESITEFFDSKDCVHIKLCKEYEYNGFKYNMFFIDVIDKIG